MDQGAVTLCQEGKALLLDCRSRAVRQVAMTAPEISILVVNSGVKHALADGEYAKRRAQCESAAQLLGVKSLRDVALADLKPPELAEVEFRRARHVVTENARVHAFVEALESGNWKAAGALMRASHVSLRDDFEVSCPELDLLVELASLIPGVHGCRMTGGGFGGCAVSLVKTEAVQRITRKLDEAYEKRTGRQTTIFSSRPAAGARVLKSR